MAVELDQESFERGWEKAIGVPTPEPVGEWGRFSAAIGFGDVWNREELTNREKRLVVLTIAALGANDGALRTHLDAARRKDELDEAAIHELAIVLTAYAGLPVGTSFMTLAAGLATEQEVDGDG